MACFSLGFLKKYVLISGFLSIIIGIAAVVYSIIAIEKRGDDFTSENAYKSYNILLIIMMVLGGMLLLLGIFSIWGSRNQNKCLLGMSKICSYILAFLFFVLVIITVIFLYAIGSDITDEDKCYDNFYFGKTGKYDKVAQEMFCSDDCPCYMTESNKQKYVSDAKMKYSDDEDDKTITNCDKFKEEIGDKYSGAKAFLKALENSLHCSGLCEKSPYYLYTDINKKVDEKDSCAEVLSEEIDTNFFIYMIVSIVLFVFMLFNICAARKLAVAKEDPVKAAKKYIDQQQK